MRSVDTFFRGHRRETFINGAAILCNAAGEKRLKLSMKLPLTGDQLVAMPQWVSEPFSDISKPEYAVKNISSTMELDPMILRVFAMPQADTAAITFDGVRLCSFKIERDGEGETEHPDIILTFTAYLPRTGKFLKFADDNFNSSLFIQFEAAQASLLDENPNVKPVDVPSTNGEVKLVSVATVPDGEDDDEEEDEPEPGPIAHHGEPTPAQMKKKGKPPLGQKRDGYGKPVAGVQ
jgi:hypothetical protein